jgi:hypothetical protein
VIDHNGAWLPEVTVGLPIIVVGLLILLVGAGICLAVGVAEDLTGVGWILVATVALGAVLTGVGYWPFMGDYHRLQPTTGVVKAVDSRFLAASSYVVVTYDTGLVVRCDDSRCATVRQGETLKLLCTKDHQFGSPYGADGWACRWGQTS